MTPLSIRKRLRRALLLVVRVLEDLLGDDDPPAAQGR